jgi:hypothetical protein
MLEIEYISRNFNPSPNPNCDRLTHICKYVAVPNSLVSCWKYLMFPLCHGESAGHSIEDADRTSQGWLLPLGRAYRVFNTS